MSEGAHTLDHELEAFRTLLPTMVNEEGRFALVADGALLGTYDTYADALQSGYAKRGLESFLVKQIATMEVAANFTRSLRAA